MKSKRNGVAGAAYAMALLLALTAGTANAALISRLGGAAAYDDVLDITWITNAGLSGLNTWGNQVAWADNLDTLGYNDWRLASINELAHMYTTNLGGTGGANKTGNQTSVDGVTFTNIQSRVWSGTEFDSGIAWSFFFDDGGQGDVSKNGRNAGWAVRSGDVGAAVPEPSVALLLASGLFGLMVTRRQRRR